MVPSVVDIFASAVGPKNARIEQLPPIVLVFGGPLGNPNDSAREMFITWTMINKPVISKLIRTPEQFQDWNSFTGYSNLVDFEIDAGNLAKAIVLFSESPGSFAELGSFCTSPGLSERLFIVIEKKYYDADSFIANGPIKKIELLGFDHSICVLPTLTPTGLTEHLHNLCAALEEKIATLPKSLSFHPDRHRDQFLLVADLVDLFGALTEKELYALVRIMDVQLDFAALRRITSQLLRFELIVFVPGVTKRYFVAPKARIAYLDYASAKDAPAFDRMRFKLIKVTPWINADKPRLTAYSEVHPKV